MVTLRARTAREAMPRFLSFFISLYARSLAREFFFPPLCAVENSKRVCC